MIWSTLSVVQKRIDKNNARIEKQIDKNNLFHELR